MVEKKDWTGNKNSIFKTLGASNHTEKERSQFDYYATDPKAGKMLLELENFHNILEPACGEGHLATGLESTGTLVVKSDLIDRGVGDVKNFMDYTYWNGDIITNPPYKYAKSFIEHALKIIPEGRKTAMFLKIQFLEGKARKILFRNYPPRTIYVSSSRILCAKNGEFEKMIKGGGSAVAYAWFVWVKGHKGDTIVKWFN